MYRVQCLAWGPLLTGPERIKVYARPTYKGGSMYRCSIYLGPLGGSMYILLLMVKILHDLKDPKL